MTMTKDRLRYEELIAEVRAIREELNFPKPEAFGPELGEWVTRMETVLKVVMPRMAAIQKEIDALKGTK